MLLQLEFVCQPEWLIQSLHVYLETQYLFDAIFCSAYKYQSVRTQDLA